MKVKTYAQNKQKKDSDSLPFYSFSEDVPICPDCISELSDKNNRRFLYPFIHCANCGPRYSVMSKSPLSRATTSFRRFKICKQCQNESQNQGNRRYNLETICCPECGPSIHLLDNDGDAIKCQNPIEETIKLIKDGNIIAVRGFGGFHIVCDAIKDAPVEELRLRKNQTFEPFPVLCPDIDTISAFVNITDTERELLESAARPVMFIRRKESITLSEEVAPDISEIPVMLPSNPIQYLILRNNFPALIFLSAASRDNPTIVSIQDAVRELAPIVDYFLVHNLETVNPSDDSLASVIDNKPLILRRGRGYITQSIPVTTANPAPEPVVGVGSDRKSTLCFVSGGNAFITRQHGNLKSALSFASFKKEYARMTELLKTSPDYITTDTYSGYVSTKYAHSRKKKCIPIEHDFAHIASCLAENKVSEKVIGVVYDGGYTREEHFRGAQFLICDLAGFSFAGHLQPVELPGGERSFREPWRVALAYLRRAFGYQVHELQMDLTERIGKSKVELTFNMLDRNINCPAISSMRCLFDAAAAIVGACIINTYEEQSSLELESLISRLKEPEEKSYPFEIKIASETPVIDPTKLIIELTEDVLAGKPIQNISAIFHNSVASFTLHMCQLLRKKENLKNVALSGSLFQSKYLASRIISLLKKDGFTVYHHSLVPPNDAGLSFGQAAAATAALSASQAAAY